MLYLVSYDIVDDRRRGRVHDLLKGFGRRVQYSVFECGLEAAEVEEMMERLGVEMEEGEDSCRIYRLCAGCEGEVRIIGRGERFAEPRYFVV